MALLRPNGTTHQGLVLKVQLTETAIISGPCPSADAHIGRRIVSG
jgi:hypothetical protein